jgi:predicted transposase YbfD/YdcC
VRGLFYQALLVVCIGALVSAAVANAVINMRARGIPMGFGFWNQVAGFDINLHSVSRRGCGCFWTTFPGLRTNGVRKTWPTSSTRFCFYVSAPRSPIATVSRPSPIGERLTLDFLQRFLPFDRGVPSGRWLNIMMNRIDPDLFAACFMDWVRACWPASLDTIAIDGKTVRGSHDDKTNETTAIPLLLEKLAAGRSLKGALVTIDAIACNPTIARSIGDAEADYLLAVKGNQPTLLADVEAAEEDQVETAADVDKGHGRIETRAVSVLRQVDWLDGDRRFPGELRFPDARAIVRVEARTELKDRCRFDARYYITSSPHSAVQLAQSIRGHWGIENTLHWTLDVTFREDLSRVGKGHGAQNMALVRKFAINKLRAAPPPAAPPNLPVKPCRKPTKPPRPKSLKPRRKIASWNVESLAEILTAQVG